MRSLYAVVMVAFIAPAFLGCGSALAPGVRGGIVDALSEEAVPPRSETTFVYSGERGTIEGVSLPDYTMTVFDFGDVRLSLRVPAGWSAEQVPMGVLVTNEAADAGMLIQWSEYPDFEVSSIHAEAQGEEDFEVSPLEGPIGARHVTTFAYSRNDGISGMIYGAYTRHDDLQSGVVVGGDWPSAYSDAGRRALVTVFDSIVIEPVPESCVRR